MFRKVLNDKIGNLLVYLAQNISDLSMTKALKLLYIIDETSMVDMWLARQFFCRGQGKSTVGIHQLHGQAALLFPALRTALRTFDAAAGTPLRQCRQHGGRPCH